MTIDLGRVRDLLREDGGDVVLVAEEPGGVRLRLVLESASCAECVVPRPMLEDVASTLLGTRVTIEDPREAAPS